MDQALKSIVLQGIVRKLTLHMKTEHPEEVHYVSASLDPNVKQGLTVHELKEEVEKETPTGEAFALVLAMDGSKTEEENRKNLAPFIGRRR